jgi:LPS O-antigen subunit length determinant protein (WzzB/FepE family)
MSLNKQTYDNASIQSIEEHEEINLISIAMAIWGGRKTLIISIGVGVFLGIIIAFISPKEYTVSTIMVTQTGSDISKSQLSGLSSLAGINIGIAQCSELSPQIYPKIVNSIPFKLDLMNTPVHFSGVPKSITLLEYYSNPDYNKLSLLGALKKYTLGLPGIIIAAVRNKPVKYELPSDMDKGKLISLSNEQKDIIKQLDKKISLTINKKDGYQTLTVSMPEALVAAELAQKALDLLQCEIIKYKVKKSQADLNYIQERYNLAEAEEYQIKNNSHKNLNSSLPQVNNIQFKINQYGITSGVYQDLTKQLEQAKILVKLDTPVFTIVEPVTIPSEISKPNRSRILYLWIFVGFIVGVGIILCKQFVMTIKTN